MPLDPLLLSWSGSHASPPERTETDCRRRSAAVSLSHRRVNAAALAREHYCESATLRSRIASSTLGESANPSGCAA